MLCTLYSFINTQYSFQVLLQSPIMPDTPLRIQFNTPQDIMFFLLRDAADITFKDINLLNKELIFIHYAPILSVRRLILIFYTVIIIDFCILQQGPPLASVSSLSIVLHLLDVFLVQHT